MLPIKFIMALCMAVNVPIKKKTQVVTFIVLWENNETKSIGHIHTCRSAPPHMSGKTMGFCASGKLKKNMTSSAAWPTLNLTSNTLWRPLTRATKTSAVALDLCHINADSLGDMWTLHYLQSTETSSTNSLQTHKFTLSFSSYKENIISQWKVQEVDQGWSPTNSFDRQALVFHSQLAIGLGHRRVSRADRHVVYH